MLKLWSRSHGYQLPGILGRYPPNFRFPLIFDRLVKPSSQAEILSPLYNKNKPFGKWNRQIQTCPTDPLDKKEPLKLIWESFPWTWPQKLRFLSFWTRNYLNFYFWTIIMRIKHLEPVNHGVKENSRKSLSKSNRHRFEIQRTYAMLNSLTSRWPSLTIGHRFWRQNVLVATFWCW